MGKSTGFLEYERAIGPDRAIEERIRDYREVCSWDAVPPDARFPT